MALSLTVEDVAKKIMNLTAACLRAAINAAMVEKFGPQWVATYRNDFNQRAKAQNVAELRNDVTSIKDFDFQACLKLFVHMPKYRDIVLQKYNIQDKAGFNNTANDLIKFRNRWAHAGGQGGSPLDTYTYEQGIAGMKAIVSCFPNVFDKETNKTYYAEIEDLMLKYTMQRSTKAYLFDNYAELRKYSDEALANACLKLHIHTEYNENNRLVFYSFDVAADIPRISLELQKKFAAAAQAAQSAVPAAPQPQKKINKKVLAGIVAVAAILIVILALLISFISRRQQADDTMPDSGVTVTASTTVPSLQDTAEDIIAAAGSMAQDFLNEQTTAAPAAAAQSGGTGGTNQIPEDMRAIIEASDPWPEEISVGETHIPSRVLFWLENGYSVQAYSGDTSIATVGDDMIVTAHAPGVVRIVFVGEYMGHSDTWNVKYTIT